MAIQMLTLTEYPNLDALRAVLVSPNLYPQDRAGYQAYYDLAIANVRGDATHGEVTVNYGVKTYAGAQFARRYPIKEVSPCPKWGIYQWAAVRTALFADEEFDVDAVACHLSILQKLCRKHEFKSPNLDKFLLDRESFYSQFNITQEQVDNYNTVTKSDRSLTDFGKFIVTATLYGSGLANIQSSLLIKTNPISKECNPLIKELKALTNKIVSHPDYREIAGSYVLYKAMERENKQVLPASCMAFILAEFERQSVDRAIEYLQSRGFTVTVYIYDGFQVRTKDKSALLQALKVLNAMESEEEIGLKYVVKPFKASILDLTFTEQAPIALPSEDEQFCPVKFNLLSDLTVTGISSDAELRAKKEYLERYFAVITELGCIAMFSGTGYTLLSMKRFTDTWCNLTYTCSSLSVPTTKPFTIYWLGLADRKAYQNVCWTPSTVNEVPMNPYTFNTFKQLLHKVPSNWSTLKPDMSCVTPWLYHIEHILAAGDTEVSKYIINWTAHLVQRPNRKVGTTLIFKSSREGAGKNSYTDYLTTWVIGSKFCREFSDINDILKPFNADSEHCLLTCLNEIGSNGAAFKNHSKIKDAITRDRQAVERKGVDRYTSVDMNNYIMTSNDNWVVKVAPSDRRFLCSECSNKNVDNETYFKGIRNLFNEYSGFQFFLYLLQVDLSDFNPRAIPITPWKRALKENSYDAYIKTLIKLNGYRRIHSSDLMSLYNSQCDDRHQLDKFTNVKSFNSSWCNHTLWEAPKYVNVNGVKRMGFDLSNGLVLDTCRKVLKDPTWEFETEADEPEDDDPIDE